MLDPAQNDAVQADTMMRAARLRSRKKRSKSKSKWNTQRSSFGHEVFRDPAEILDPLQGHLERFPAVGVKEGNMFNPIQWRAVNHFP